MNFNINLVEDDVNLNTILQTYLKNEGFEVRSFLSGEEALNAVEDKPHLWILDIMLPDIDGFRIIQEIKRVDDTIPVIFISARDADIDRIVGLEMGSDDYLSKPFLPRELVIRCKKLLERTYRENLSNKGENVSGYLVDKDKRIVTLDGNEIELSSKEFDLLLLLMNNKQKSFSREQILIEVWGQDYFGSDRVVDDLVRRLRKRMPELRLETVYGYGYRLNER